MTRRRRAGCRNARLERIGRWVLPVAILSSSIWAVGQDLRLERDPALHPAATVAWCWRRSWTDGGLLFSSLLVTLRITFLSLLLAVVGGVGLAILFTQSKWIEMSLFPFAIVLQVTPIVAIFPLINIYVDNQTAKLLLCSWIVAFFPILSNTTLGLNSVDRNLIDLFRLNGATALAAAVAFAAACRDAVFPGRLEDRRRPVADRRGRRRSSSPGSSGQSSGLASRIIESRLSPERATAIRCLVPDLVYRHPDLSRAVAGIASHPAQLARKRASAER